MVEKYYRDALGKILDYVSERKECSIYLEVVEQMALDALHGKDLNETPNKIPPKRS